MISSTVLFCEESEEGDSRTMPNPRTWFSPVEVRSAAWRSDCSEATAVFFSVSNALGFCFTVRGSTVFGGTFFFLFLLRETAVRWEHIREIGGCCLFWVPTAWICINFRMVLSSWRMACNVDWQLQVQQFEPTGEFTAGSSPLELPAVCG